MFPMAVFAVLCGTGCGKPRERWTFDSTGWVRSNGTAILKTMTREELHRLVDTVPEPALESAEKGLRYFQKWPPVPPHDVERIRREHLERMRLSMRPGTSGTSMGG